MIRNYPKKSSIRRVIEDHLSAKDSKDFLKKRGILVHCINKSDLAKIGGDYYLNNNDYSELKSRMDSEQNYKKSGRLSFAKENLEQFEETLISLNNQFINRDDNTKLIITKKSNGNTKILLTYDEYKPSLIDLLDKSTRQVEITLNTHSDTCSLDFDLQAPNDYKKVKELITYLTSTTGEIQFDFEEISLNKLTKLQRIELFDKFFKSIKKPWSLVEIKKLKVKRETSEEENVLGDTLQGINSAVLDGDNLRENQFVKSTLSTGFYFSMASMRLNHSSKPQFIDLVMILKQDLKCVRLK